MAGTVPLRKLPGTQQLVKISLDVGIIAFSCPFAKRRLRTIRDEVGIVSKDVFGGLLNFLLDFLQLVGYRFAVAFDLQVNILLRDALLEVNAGLILLDIRVDSVV